MQISNNRQLIDLKDDFEKKFPFLKIRFHNTPYQDKRSCNDAHLLNSKAQIGEVRNQTNFGFYTLDEDMPVGTFEQEIWNLFGLHVQVFRKSYGKWLQTWATDNLTLKEQNDRSKILGDKK